MRKKKKRVMLPNEEIYAILRAADDIIGEGGRTLVSKILKGSKEKKLLELGLGQNPAYGFFAERTMEEVMEKVDWMIQEGFLDTEMSGRLPMIVFTPIGWLIERDRRGSELLDQWDVWVRNGITPLNMIDLKDCNRGMMLLFLRKVLLTNDEKYIPFLKKWAEVDYKKVRDAIAGVVQILEQQDVQDPLEWEMKKGELAQELLVPSKDPVILACHECGMPFVINGTEPENYTEDGFQVPVMCNRC
jgi:hypothetical protein